MRNKILYQAGWTGILVNVLLAAGKAIIGFAAHSSTMIIDAVNNLMSAITSVITVLGAFFTNRPADKKHPYGYGRVEYIATMVVGMVVIYTGVTSLVASVQKVLVHEVPEYHLPAMAFICIAAVAKFLLGRYMMKQGHHLESESLHAIGMDSIVESILCLSVLISFALLKEWDIDLEQYLGIVMALLILKDGYEVIRSMIGSIIGRRENHDYIREVIREICQDPEVYSAHNLFIHNYGFDKNFGSVNIEVPPNLTSEEIGRISRRIYRKILDKYKVPLEAIETFSTDLDDPTVAEMYDEILMMLHKREGVSQIYGFYCDAEHREAGFHLVPDYDSEDRKDLIPNLKADLKEHFPDYEMEIIESVDV